MPNAKRHLTRWPGIVPRQTNQFGQYVFAWCCRVLLTAPLNSPSIPYWGAVSGRLTPHAATPSYRSITGQDHREVTNTERQEVISESELAT